MGTAGARIGYRSGAKDSQIPHHPPSLGTQTTRERRRTGLGCVPDWERAVESAGPYAVNPPSIVRLAPVTKPASGLARYATIAAISSAVP